MDSDSYVPLEVIARFHKVQSLSTDMPLITAALEKSHALQLDDSKTKIRAAPRQQRTTVVLRDMPATTTAQVCTFCLLFLLCL
jgi:hypothetical protein